MDVADQLEDCSPTHKFLLMLLDRVQGLEDGIQRIEKVLADPLHGLHGTNELHNIRDCLLQFQHVGVDASARLERAPSDAAVQVLRSRGFRVWECVLDRQAYAKALYLRPELTDNDGFTVYHFVTRANTPDPKPMPHESFKELPYVKEMLL